MNLPAYSTPVPFKVNGASDPVMDGAGRVFIAFQAEKDDHANTKYCRVMRRVDGPVEAYVDVGDVPEIYGIPALMLRCDGGCTVSGFNRDRSRYYRADVIGFVARKP